MHNSTATLSKLVVPDANVWLDAAFVEGLSRRSIDLLSQIGVTPLLVESVREECLKKLQERALSLGLVYDPALIWFEYINRFEKISVPSVLPELALSVNKPDRHVIAAAKQYGAWVLTGDAPLIVQAEKIGVSARFPWDVVGESLRNGPVSLEELIRCVPLDRDQGYIFGRFLPGNWIKPGSPVTATAFHIENVGRLYYETLSSSWIFKTSLGGFLKLPFVLLGDRPCVVCVSYRFSKTKNHLTVMLRAGYYSEKPKSAPGRWEVRFGNAGPGKQTVCRSNNGSDHWNGVFQDFLTGPQSVSSDTFKALLAIVNSAPNPFDANSLSPALSLLNRKYLSLLSQEVKN